MEAKEKKEGDAVSHDTHLMMCVVLVWSASEGHSWHAAAAAAAAARGGGSTRRLEARTHT